LLGWRINQDADLKALPAKAAHPEGGRVSEIARYAREPRHPVFWLHNDMVIVIIRIDAAYDVEWRALTCGVAARICAAIRRHAANSTQISH
jgi:hypothetical protein